MLEEASTEQDLRELALQEQQELTAQVHHISLLNGFRINCLKGIAIEWLYWRDSISAIFGTASKP